MSFKIDTSDTIDCRGNLVLTSGTLTLKDGQISRSKLAQDTSASHTVPVTAMRVWDDFNALLPGTAATDDLGVIEGTFGTDAVTLQTSDLKATSGTQRARFHFVLPTGYVSGDTISVRVRAGMITTVSDTTATVDVECYAHDGDGAVGSDLCTTAAQDINSLTKSSFTFSITPTGRAPGDVLDIRLSIAITDSATGTAVIGEISKVEVLADII